VGLLILATRAKKAGIDHILFPGECLPDLIKQHISKAYKHFKFLTCDDNLRNTWLCQVIAVQAEAWNQTKKVLWTQLCSTERIKRMAHNVCCALHKTIIHKPLTTVIAPSTGALRQEFSQKVELEQACLEEAGRLLPRREIRLFDSSITQDFWQIREVQDLGTSISG